MMLDVRTYRVTIESVAGGGFKVYCSEQVTGRSLIPCESIFQNFKETMAFVKDVLQGA